MDQEYKKKIASLEAKNKQLERDLSERVRNYLTRGNKQSQSSFKKTQDVQTWTESAFFTGKNMSAPENKSQQVQTEHQEYFQGLQLVSKLKKKDVAHIFSQQNMDQTPSKPSESKLTLLSIDESPHDDMISEVSHRDIGSFTGRQFPDELNKAMLSNIMEKLVEQQKSQISKEQDYQAKDLDVIGGNLEAWKWKGKVKKLKEQLKFQIQMADCAKEGLLLSEEENYRFRLQLQEMHHRDRHINSMQLCPEVMSVVVKSRGESEKGVFRQGEKEKSCETDNSQGEVQQLRRQVERLNEQLLQRQQQIASLIVKENSLTPRLGEFQSKMGQKNVDVQRQDCSQLEQIENIKDIAFEISSLVPLCQHFEGHQFFRPEDLYEVAAILERSARYLRQVQERESKKKQEGEKEKVILTTLLGKVGSALSPDSRSIMADIMKRENQLTAYSRLIEGSFIK